MPAKEPNATSEEETQPSSSTAEKAKPEPRRSIAGNFSYTNSAGVLAKAIQKLTVSERPPQFTTDFLGSVLGATGGSSRPIIPILKKSGFLRADGVPTELYAQFQNETKRPQAALEALKTGWPELFRRNQYVNRLERKPTEDLFVEITGLTRDDPILRSIISTYNVFHEYAKGVSNDTAAEGGTPQTEARNDGEDGRRREGDAVHHRVGTSVGLVNQISIILPETTDINVYNAIFRSLRENLLS